MLSFLSQPINHPCSTSLLSSLSKPLQISVLLYIYEISFFGSLLSVKGAAGVSRPASFHLMPGLFHFILLSCSIPKVAIDSILCISFCGTAVFLCVHQGIAFPIPHPLIFIHCLMYSYLRFYSNPYNLFFSLLLQVLCKF